MLSSQSTSGSNGQIIELRITHPPGNGRPKNDAGLVLHEDRLFSFEEMLLKVPEQALYAALANGPRDPQEWWDELCRSHPSVTSNAISRCRCYGTVEPCRILPFRRPQARQWEALSEPGAA